MKQINSFILVTIHLFLLLTSLNGFSMEKTFEYLYRDNCHKKPTADHLICVEQFSTDRVIEAGNLGLAIIDPNKLPEDGT